MPQQIVQNATVSFSGTLSVSDYRETMIEEESRRRRGGHVVFANDGYSLAAIFPIAFDGFCIGTL